MRMQWDDIIASRLHTRHVLQHSTHHSHDTTYLEITNEELWLGDVDYKIEGTSELSMADVLYHDMEDVFGESVQWRVD